MEVFSIKKTHGFFNIHINIVLFAFTAAFFIYSISLMQQEIKRCISASLAQNFFLNQPIYFRKNNFCVDNIRDFAIFGGI